MASLGSTLCLLLLAIHGSIQESNPTSLTYRAAVLELRAKDYTNNATETLLQNGETLVRYIEEAAKKEVDIIVLPELALTSLTLGTRSDVVSRSTLIPHPSENYAPCRNSSIPVQEAFKNIACAAERNGIYVVINLLEKELCSGKDCPSDGMFVFLSSAVFDRKGRIIARSRKDNPVDKYGILDILKTPEVSIFETDFGVTFGSIVCFDIMFEEAWPELKKLNINDIVHASGWYSSMPFLTTTQMVSGWAYINDVNLLSSGYNKIEWGNSGSGIYAGREGVLTAVLSMEDHNEMLIADVRKKMNKTTVVSTAVQNSIEHHGQPTNLDDNEHVHIKLHNGRDSGGFRWLYDDLGARGFESKLITENGLTVQKLSQGGIECGFRVNMSNLNPLEATYRLVAYDDDPLISKTIIMGFRICAIVMCADNTIESCGHVVFWNSSATLNSAHITATYVDNGRTILMPNTVKTSLLPVNNWTWDQHKQEERVYTAISLTTPTQNVATFGILGRNYEKDGFKLIS